MSKKEPGCLSFLLGPCYRKRNRNRYAVSIENFEIRTNSTSTQTIIHEHNLRSSAPANIFPQAHKPIIAVRGKKGFHLQENLNNSSRVASNKENIVSMLLFSEEIDSIRHMNNDDKMLSTKTIEDFFAKSSPKNIEKPLANPFIFDSNSIRPKLMPITPDQFNKRKLVPNHRTYKPYEKVIPDSSQDTS